MEEETTRAFRFSYTKVVDSLKTKVTIEVNGRKKEVVALWDTGANCCAVSEDVVKDLSLIKTGETNLLTPGGSKRANTYLVDHIFLPNAVVVHDVKVTDSEIGTQGIGLLIGMNIISLGDFLVCNSNGHTVFSFRTPSEPIPDFVTGIRLRNVVGQKHGKGKRKKK